MLWQALRRLPFSFLAATNQIAISKNDLVAGSNRTMIRAGEGFVMQAQSPIVNARSGRLTSNPCMQPAVHAKARLGLFWVATISLLITPALGQTGGSGSHPAPPPNPPAPIPRPMDSNFDRAHIELDSTGKPLRPNNGDDRCLLPPLNGTREPVVDVKSMQVSEAGRKEYAAAYDANSDKKFDRAADHLRKAVQGEPLYSAGWVTLGQVLVAQQKIPEAREACSHAIAVIANYLAGYLCLADIAGRQQKW